MNLHAAIRPVVCMGLLQLGLAHAQQLSAPKQDADLQLLKKQMLELQDSFNQMKAAHAEEITALRAQIDAQQKTITELQTGGAPPLPAKAPEGATPAPAPSNAPLFPVTDDSVVASPTPSATSPAAPGTPPASGAGAFPTADTSVVEGSTTPSLSGPAPTLGPITIGGSKTYMNISFDGMFALAFSTEKHLDQLEVGDHDPHQRGFNARNVELALDGAIDPYLEGFANIVFKLDNDNETEVEVEEAFMQTTSLPWGLQLKGGQFFAAFGRINPQHPHVWDFADHPLVAGKLLGGDGLRGVGAQVSWVMPFTWYSQMSLGIQNGRGGTAYSFRNPGDDGEFFGRETINREMRGFQDFVFIPRWESSVDFTPTQTLLFGVSGAFGPNDTGANARTQIYAADLFYKWKPSNAEGGFPFVKWQSEAMVRRFDAGRGAHDEFPVSETFTDWGLYSQVVWGFEKGWTAGVRGDYVHFQGSEFTDDPDRQSRWRLSANLTWYPSEFSKLRLQYNHDFLDPNDVLDRRDEDSVFLQFEFGLGSHSAHKF